MTKPFSLAYKKKMVERVTGRDAVSARALSRETGVTQTTLSRWREEARSLPVMPPRERKTKGWSVEDKVRILSEAQDLTGRELAAYLEREGVLLAQLEQWRLAQEEEGVAPKAVAKRIRALERELARKAKALAEAAALLILKKKGGAPGGGRGRRHGRGERELILAALTAAQAAGARLDAACLVVGLSARTVERWRARPDGDDRRCGPRRRPSNALSAADEAQVVSVLTSARWARVSAMSVLAHRPMSVLAHRMRP